MITYLLYSVIKVFGYLDPCFLTKLFAKATSYGKLIQTRVFVAYIAWFLI